MIKERKEMYGKDGYEEVKKPVKIGLTACSNGQLPERAEEINRLMQCLAEMGVHSVKAPHLFAQNGVFGGTGRQRAEDLMAFYRDETIDVICDISGGDIANGVLPFLDYGLIEKSRKAFWGYSDLTTIINAIYAKTGKKSVLYQVKNLVRKDSGLQKKRFHDFLEGDGTGLFDIRYEFLQGKGMEGIVIGGNIRCLLKLAGTPYWPDMDGKILLLEALNGEAAQMAAYFAQLSQMGVLERVSGILLGTFTRLEQSGTETAFAVLSSYIGADRPVARTPDIGHAADAKAIVIGAYARF